MNIAIDIQPLVSGSNERGMGRYTADLLMEMFRQDHENKYFIFNIYGKCIYDEMDLPSNVHYEKFYMGQDNYLLHYEEKGGQLYLPYENITCGIFQTFIQKNNIDLFLITSLFDSGVMCYRREWFHGAKLAIIAYDLIPLVFREAYLNDPYRAKQYYNNLECLKTADVIFAISNSVKADLEGYLDIDPQKIAVIHSGVSGIFRKESYTEAQKCEIFKKHGIVSQYMIFPGGADFRKNVEGTIMAYSRMPEDLIEQYQLIITGSAPKEYIAAMNDYIAQNGVKGRVLLTGFISDEELILLYNSAELVIFPSLYEGFGLPVIEAFACGKNVVTSNNSSLGEVAQGAAVLVNPFDIDDIKRGFVEALTQTDFSVFQEKINQKLQLYVWENTAKMVLATINGMQGTFLEESNKKRIAFFSPMPPIPSGIADYSEELLNELCKYCDIDVFIDDGYQTVSKLPDNVHIFNHHLFGGKAKQYSAIIYQMGNSDFHLYMLPYIWNYPGTVVIHDLNMHECIYHIYAMKQNWGQYREFLRYEVDDIDTFITCMQSDAGFAQQAIGEITVNRFVTEFAKNIIVHSDYSRAKLLEKNIGYQVKKIHLFANRELRQDTKKLRQRYGIALDETVIASFGQAAGIKRIFQILQALLPILEENEKVKYYIVGRVLDPEILEYIKKMGLQEKVVITGFVKDIEIFKDYIDLSDICLNLRYPYYGETSASFMRILAAGKSSIVTDIGAFSEIPDNCCVKIGYDEDTEVTEIEQAVRKLIRDKEYAASLGENAIKFAQEKLDVRKSAAQYFGFVTSKVPSYLSEANLYRIYEHEMLPRNIAFREEAEKLSATLAYLIDEEATGTLQETMRNQVNVGSIMDDIHNKLQKHNFSDGSNS